MRALAAGAAVLMLGACTASEAEHTVTPSGPFPKPPATPPAKTAGSGGSESATRPPAGPRTATILGSGDVLIHPPLWMQAHRDAHHHGYDFGPMYASIKPDVERADLAICEMETPLAKPSGP